MSANDVVYWLTLAKEDHLDTAVMCASNGKPRPACWHSQQSVEKTLKAALISENADFPHIHVPDELRDMLPAGWSVKSAHSSPAKITKYAI